MRKSYKPTSPGRRHAKRRVNMEFGVKALPKRLRRGGSGTGGRNNRGRITSFHRGGGFKQLRRKVTWQRPVEVRQGVQVEGATSTLLRSEVIGIQYDPIRTARLALIRSSAATGSTLEYVLAAEGRKVGDWRERGCGAGLRNGNSLPLAEIPVGSSVFGREVQPGGGSQRVRSAGGKAVLLQKQGDLARVRMPSGERRRLPVMCMASLGSVGSGDHLLEVVGKAGRRRNRGWRPVVRGVAMNPIDHPHGGRTKGGVPTVTPWARVAKGQPTRSRRKTSVFIAKPRKATSASGR